MIILDLLEVFSPYRQPFYDGERLEADAIHWAFLAPIPASPAPRRPVFRREVIHAPPRVKQRRDPIGHGRGTARESPTEPANV